ncbi:hypothetical protein [Labrys miyagiensis]|nr:hypothetical protein [Labrys miyagiensis]
MDREIGYSIAVRQEEISSAEEAQLADQLFSIDATSIAGITAKIDGLIATGEPGETSDEFPWPELRKIRSNLFQIIHQPIGHTG